MGFISPVPGSTAVANISLEPTVYLDQMKRYIDHLHELRRMSDGDDTADAPGYSLNLLRIPVSVLPGKRTQQRYGAEITLTLKPHLNDELLPMTFRNLITNDLLDEIGVPLTHVLNDIEWDRAMSNLWHEIQQQSPKCDDQTRFERFVNALASILEASNPRSASSDQSPSRKPFSLGKKPSDETQHVDAYYKSFSSGQKLSEETARVSKFLGVRSSSRLRTGLEAFPPSEIVDIYGTHNWAEIVCTAWVTFDEEVPNKDIVHYPDVQGFLQQELDAAYNMLKLDQATQSLWLLCDQLLVNNVHGRNVCEVAKTLQTFNTAAKGISQSTKKPELTTALAWALLVDSALLNNRLCEDMVQAPEARGGHFNLPGRGSWPQYFLPNPGKPERDAFNEYVRCRWPIHVFSLDPEDDTQNIADSYSMRREMQLAMSLAFVSGNLSANNLFQYARRLETDMETIALNKTSVGFSHGTDTFGWRFYPRFQSPDTPSNCVAFWELVWGGPNRKHLLRQRQLEPGIRECVAIVLMPSFVPYADLDASSNFFALDNPRRKLMNSKKAIRLGEQVKMIENCSQFIGHAECCRDGDIERLLNRTKQLESRLPLQSMSVQVPYENTIGGFAMFNTGVTNLAPEVLGWYGSPAINLDAPTTIFLIGNHFSVHQTRVIIGGQEITANELLSRQVMKVTIPQNAITLVEKTGFVSGGFTLPTDPFLQKALANCYDPCDIACPGKENCEKCPKDQADPKACEQTSAEEPPLQLVPAQPTVPPAPGQPSAQPGTAEKSMLDAFHFDPGSGSTAPSNPNDIWGHYVTSPAKPGCILDPKDPKTWIQTPSKQTVDQDHGLIFPNCAITLHDPGVSNPSLPGGMVSLTVAKGTVALGKLNGITVVSGTNGSATVAFRGNLNDLQQALNGLTYIPKAGWSGIDVLTIYLQGSGINSPCTVNVAINVHAKPPQDYLFVDVQMATPYGATSHMLIPAAHLTSTGSGPPAGSASSGSSGGALPQWTSMQATLGYVNKGIGIVACDPPSFTPTSLSINLGADYVAPSNNAVTVTFNLSGGASGPLAAQTFALTPTSWDSAHNVLTIAGSDLATFTSNLMNAIQYQFGVRQGTPAPPASFTVGASVTDLNNPTPFKLTNTLTVNLVRVFVPPQFPVGP
jgi:hypothetical protein